MPAHASAPRRTIAALERRALSTGGFPAFPGGDFCPASTAWATLALPLGNALASPAHASLSRALAADGRLPIHPDHPQAPWPSAPALMALLGAAPFAGRAARLRDYLLGAAGAHWPKDPLAPTDHDTSLPGWSWTDGAHSWIEPTALAMLALSAAGQRGHQRLLQAEAMLLDRLLPSGGWNMGTVHVYGALLFPDLVNTSAALCALAGRVAPGVAGQSLDYLEAGAKASRAPLSLAWAVLALGSWGRETANAQGLLSRLLTDHPVTGPLHTATLALACIAQTSPDGLAAHLERRTTLHAA